MIRHIVFQTVFFSLLYQLNCQQKKTQREKNEHFLSIVNDIFGPNKNLLTDVELQMLLKRNEVDEKFSIFENDKLQDKMWKLGCKYTELCLYIMYHIKYDMVNKNNIKYNVLQVFKIIVHRMLSIYYYIIGITSSGIWYTSITINALVEQKIPPQEIRFTYIQNMLNFCRFSYHKNNLQYLPKTNNNYPNLDTIYEISKQLKLHPDFNSETFNEIYQYEDVSNVYSFFWDNDDGYKTFIPKEIFPSYNESHIETTYITVCQYWKKDYFILWEYTDALKRNLLLVTYYYLARHSICLLNFFLNAFDEGVFLNLFKIPLNTITEIGVFSSELLLRPFIDYVDDMKNDKIINQQTLMMYTTKVIGSFNILANNFKISNIKRTDIINNDSSKNPLKHSDVENQLMLYATNLQNYFEKVRNGMAPVDFVVLKIFKTSKDNI
ncbi:uncharacterized protein LOC126895943 [Daktulosphaira vitifoliae]|uniref:uncharacterized protein LOC126895943 n=1 Tax=Daktulosphaira vitifoliae TaxID=58002 RepID=UPI0021A9CC40|nr:uncharacterized protein LOC126895943 [Daktulosphaira vitifoliae]